MITLENALFPGQAGTLSFAQVALVFTPALLLGGAGCGARSVLLVGVPSLRLRGDYLAIVTLGFGEIIRLVFNNAQRSGRRHRLLGRARRWACPSTPTSSGS